MDMTQTNIVTTTSNSKSPEAEIETPTRIQQTKPLTFTNGVLKRHHHLTTTTTTTTATPIVVIYKECQKNHAASLGGHALDGCGEFMPSPNATPTDPTSLKCAACGCHRNFHRREPDEPVQPPHTPNTTQVIEYQPHHRHHPPPPLPRGHSPSPPSPPPISSSYYPSSAPHMLLALSHGLQGPPPPPPPPPPPENSQSMDLLGGSTLGNASTNPNGRKRFRTKFSQGQKAKMYEFAEKVGWKMQKRDDETVADFCNEVGVDRNVLKVWMHNNKSTFGKRSSSSSSYMAADLVNGSNTSILDNINNNGNESTELHHQLHNHNDTTAHVATNGSSSSS